MPEQRARKVYEMAAGEAGGRLMVTRSAGRAVREELAGMLEALPKGGVLYVDTRGVELMDYSFADEALGILASRLTSGEYGERHLVLVESERDLLENVEASMRQRSLALIRVDSPDSGESSAVVGEVPEHLLQTLQAIHEAGSITNADLAKKLDLNHTACNNRGTKLVKLGLIHRRAHTAAPGGRQYTYERIAP
ncbi:MAG: winged helix-turn-helix domain-containing protein [Rubrobacter sp.]|nr:winged helix-turn-helix domain-containing protein [Rubrobacter sp.]